MIESHGGLIWFPKVKVTNKLLVDGNLSGHQRVGGREPSLSEEVTLGLDVHLMFVAELLVQIGGKIEQKSVGGTRLVLKSGLIRYTCQSVSSPTSTCYRNKIVTNFSHYVIRTSHTIWPR